MVLSRLSNYFPSAFWKGSILLSAVSVYLSLSLPLSLPVSLPASSSLTPASAHKLQAFAHKSFTLFH